MPRGGARAGAGRKPKPKDERQSSAQRERRQKNDALIAEAFDHEQGTPLEYMLARMRDANAPDDVRDKMAVAAAPYIHSRLVTTDAPDNAGDRENEKPGCVVIQPADNTNERPAGKDPMRAHIRPAS